MATARTRAQWLLWWAVFLSIIGFVGYVLIRSFASDSWHQYRL
jgi:hypothetical protein